MAVTQFRNTTQGVFVNDARWNQSTNPHKHNFINAVRKVDAPFHQNFLYHAEFASPQQWNVTYFSRMSPPVVMICDEDRAPKAFGQVKYIGVAPGKSEVTLPKQTIIVTARNSEPVDGVLQVNISEVQKDFPLSQMVSDPQQIQNILGTRGVKRLDWSNYGSWEVDTFCAGMTYLQWARERQMPMISVGETLRGCKIAQELESVYAENPKVMVEFQRAHLPAADLVIESAEPEKLRGTLDDWVSEK